MALSLPDPTFDAESTRRLYPTLSLFEGFPYLVTRVVPAMYHVILSTTSLKPKSLGGSYQTIDIGDALHYHDLMYCNISCTISQPAAT
jgi:hypothetical protein